MIPTILLSMFMYGILFLTVFCVAGLLAVCIPGAEKSRKRSRIVLVLCVIVVIIALSILACRPVLICPEACRSYVGEEEKERIIRLNSGPYSARIPFIPVCITVKSADVEEVLVETRYFPFGHTEMAINDDGPDPRRGIFGNN